MSHGVGWGSVSVIRLALGQNMSVTTVVATKQSQGSYAVPSASIVGASIVANSIITDS